MEAAPMILPVPLARALPDHLPRRLLVAEKIASQIDRHHPVPVLRGEVQQRFDLGDPRVRYHDV
jgi:hypothetical protein